MNDHECFEIPNYKRHHGQMQLSSRFGLGTPLRVLNRWFPMVPSIDLSQSSDHGHQIGPVRGLLRGMPRAGQVAGPCLFVEIRGVTFGRLQSSEECHW